MNAASRRALTAVARGQVPAHLYLRGATLLNVYTGELYPANVAVRGERIAYVGLRADMVGPRTRVLDLAGRVLVPGYIDPHVHPRTWSRPPPLPGTSCRWAPPPWWPTPCRSGNWVASPPSARWPMRWPARRSSSTG